MGGTRGQERNERKRDHGRPPEGATCGWPSQASPAWRSSRRTTAVDDGAVAVTGVGIRAFAGPGSPPNLRVGDLVELRSEAEITRSLNHEMPNRGRGFEAEMASYCGREAHVLRRVARCIDERIGRLLQTKNPCIVLEDVICEGAYNANCPRSIYAFGREIWLDRVVERGA